MDSLDTLIRTVAGEAGSDPRERAAVAASIINRARVQGKTIDQIVAQPGQFESWQNAQSRTRMLALRADSPAYQAIQSVVEPIYSGKVADPTNGATHFYAPKTQVALGRRAPSWDDGKGTDIGQSRFFNKGAPTASDTFDSLADVDSGQPSQTTTTSVDTKQKQAASPAAPPPLDFDSIADQSATAPVVGAMAPQVSEQPAQQAGRAPDDQFKDGLNKLVAMPGVTHQQVVDYILNSGRSPGSPNFDKQIDDAIAAKTASVIAGAPLVKDPGGFEGLFGRFENGFGHGVETIMQAPTALTAWLDNKFPAVNAVDQWASDHLGTGSPAAEAQSNRAWSLERDAYDRTLGNSRAALTGNILGQTAVTMPLFGAGGRVLGAGANAVGEAVPETQAALRFVAGNAGKAVAATDTTAPIAGNLLVRGASIGTNGAIQGGGAAALSAAGSDAPLKNQLMAGAAGGAVLAPVAAVVGGGFNKLASLTAPTIDPVVAQLAQRAADMRIGIRGSQISSSPLVRTVDSVLARIPGSGIALDNAYQRSAFTRAIGQTFGADADALTPKVMSSARSRISNVYDTVGARTNLDLNPETGSPFVDNVAQITADAKGVLGTDKLPALNNIVTNVLDKVGPDGTMSGRAYKALTSRGSMLDQATRDADPSFATAAKAIKSELNSALESSATPDDAAALRAADWQWKNMRTVERLVAKSPDGTISPALLQSPVTASFKDRAFTGAGDLGDLGDIGQLFLKPEGSSNTAERSAVLKGALTAGKWAGAIGGGMLGIKMGVTPGEMALSGLAGAGSLGVARLAGNALRSPFYRNRLIEAALHGDLDSAVPLLPTNYFPSAIAGGVANNALTQRTAPPGN